MRRKGWEAELFKMTSAAMLRPHKWGENDCVTFAADCVAVMTGDDPARDVRGTYDSALSAARVIRQAGFDDLGDMVASRIPEIGISEAQRGDLVLCDGPEGEFMAVVQGASAVGPCFSGLIHVPVAQAKRAYAVGR